MTLYFKSSKMAFLSAAKAIRYLFSIRSLSLLVVLFCQLGSFSFGQDNPAQEKAQFEKWLKEARQGDVDAQFYVGGCYSNGVGVARDDVKAVACFRVVAKNGDARAQHILGIMYELGRGVPKNLTKAAKWKKMAKDQGYIEPPDYITAQDIKDLWVNSLPKPRTLDSNFNQITKENQYFTQDLREGRLDFKAEMEALLYNRDEAIRVGDRERAAVYEKTILKLTPPKTELADAPGITPAKQRELRDYYLNAEFGRNIYVSYQTSEGWTQPVLKLVEFVNSNQRGEYEVDSDLIGCALISFSNDRIIPVKAFVTDQVDYLCRFIPTGSIYGDEVGGSRRWKLTAQWPAPSSLRPSYKVGLGKAIRSRDRKTAAEYEMILGNKDGAYSHMRALHRMYRGSKNNIKAIRIEALLAEGFGK